MSTPGDDVFHYDGLSYWGPVSVPTVERVLDMMSPPPGGTALDVGCGRAELLVRLAERYRVGAVGVDRSSSALEQARAAFASRAPDVEAEFLQKDAATLAFDDAAFDVVSWLGGPALGAGLSSAVSQLARWVRPGGYVLVGHGCWNASPGSEYLAATGISPDEFSEHWQNIAIGEAAGLRSLSCHRSSREEWDAFEGRILSNVEHYAAAHPDAPDPQGRLEQRRSWHAAQQRWGRDVMGFGLYLFKRPQQELGTMAGQ